MWTDCEDLVVVSDMYQVNIKVITSKGDKDTNPTVTWIFPDESLKEFAELKDVELEDIVLMHENDLHFNLIVSDQSELATLGSLSFRSNIGPFVDEKMVEDDIMVELEPSKSIQNTKEVKKIELELKRMKESYKKLESEYLECENQLKIKTEEAEKLKIEVKDIREFLELEQRQNSSDDDLQTHIKNKHSSWKNKKCTKCGLQLMSQEELREHIRIEHPAKETEYNCEKCPYQATSQEELNKHFQSAHTMDPERFCNECKFQTKTNSELTAHKISKHPSKDNIRCRVCGETFLSKPKLMEHRKLKHSETVANCNKNNMGKCPYSSKMCWWKHNLESNSKRSEQDFNCFNCSKTFNNKGEMMVHKKQMHRSTVRYCNSYIDDECKFNDQSCWFRHERALDELKDDVSNEKEKEDETKVSNESVFQEAQENL